MLYFFACDIDCCSYGFIRASCRRGDLYETCYKWLAQYCKFFPPLFVSTDQHKLSGYSSGCDKVLFGFKNIRGFPISYEEWYKISGVLINIDTMDFAMMDRALEEGLQDLELLGDYSMRNAGGFDEYLKNKVFIETDQYAVSGLDLRRASTIVCRSEIQKMTLMKRGFRSNDLRVASSYSRFYSS